VLLENLQHGSAAARWPIFTAAVTEQTPVRALFVLSLQWGAVNTGVLDRYRATPGGLSDLQWRYAVATTDTAAWMLLAQRTDPDDVSGDWLGHALHDRAEIHQATGMVIASSTRGLMSRARRRALPCYEERPPDRGAWISFGSSHPCREPRRSGPPRSAVAP
jgi:hypothetical protein